MRLFSSSLFSYKSQSAQWLTFKVLTKFVTQTYIFQGVKVPKLSADSFNKLGNNYDIKCVSKKFAFPWKVSELSSKANFKEDTSAQVKSAINRIF